MMKTVWQLIKEFYVPFGIAVVWTLNNYMENDQSDWTWTKAVNIAAPTFFFISWMTSQWFRVKKQEHVSTTLTKIETRVDSVMANVERQTAEMKYLADAQVFQTFDLCIDGLRDVKEELADKSRLLKQGEGIDLTLFKLQRDNHFYQSRRYLDRLITYAIHTVNTGREAELIDRYTRSGIHIEELAGHIGTMIGRMNHQKMDWKTPRSTQLVRDIAARIEIYKDQLLMYSRYANEQYKNKQSLHAVLATHIANLNKLAQ